MMNLSKHLLERNEQTEKLVNRLTIKPKYSYRRQHRKTNRQIIIRTLNKKLTERQNNPDSADRERHLSEQKKKNRKSERRNMEKRERDKERCLKEGKERQKGKILMKREIAILERTEREKQKE